MQQDTNQVWMQVFDGMAELAELSWPSEGQVGQVNSLLGSVLSANGSAVQLECMRSIIAAVLTVRGGSVALGDDTEPASADTTIASPPTTSEFGTETKIEIALDEDVNIVPASSSPGS